MLTSRKGNLLCYQWEIERVQKIHKEKMAIMAVETNIKRTSTCCRRGRKSKSIREQILETDVQRHNAFLVEKMAQIHELDGCQRRALHEFQDVKSALAFGKANVAVARVVREGRFTARKKEHEHIRKANAKMIARLASPVRSDIDFNKFENDFVKSRAYFRMAQCDRTVGHTSVFEAPSIRAPHSEAEASFGETPHRQRPLEEPTRDARPPTCPTAAQGRPRFTRYLKSRQRPFSVGFISSRPKHQGHNRNTDLRIQVLDGKPKSLASNRGGAKASTPRRPRTGTTEESRRRRPVYCPRTALGLRRGSDHHDLFDARAADTGWGSEGSRNIARPPSGSERTEWGSWRTRSTERSQRLDDRVTAGEHDWGDHKQQQLVAEEKAKQDLHDPSNRGEDSLRCLGRTLLAEAKVAVSYGSNRRNTRRRREVILQCLSLDGLIRQQQQVRKTLRGFVVEASLTPRRKPLQPHAVDGKGMDCAIGSAYVAVFALQNVLRTTGIGGNSDLALLRVAHDLDGQGNYPDLRALIGKRGLRDLCQILLGSSQVLVRKGSISVKILNTNVDGGLGLSATVATPDIAAHCLPPPCQSSPKIATEQRLLGDSGSEGSTRATPKRVTETRTRVNPEHSSASIAVRSISKPNESIQMHHGDEHR